MLLFENVRWMLVLALGAASILPAKVIHPQVAFRQSYSLGQNGRVTIQNLYGDVTVTGWDRDEVLVEAVKRASDLRRLDDAHIVVEPSEGGLSIRTLYAGSETGNPASVEYRITVPRSTRLDQIRLINGVLAIAGVSGSVKASSVNGGIRAQRMGGQVDLSTVNGTLDAEFDRISRANPISLTSVNGAIRLSIPSGAGASLTAHNRSGGIDSEFGRAARASDGHSLRTTVNHGGASIRLDNINGGISIHSTWSRQVQRTSF
jgi:DUF4097 and DUF4098 domain-containing protein YvlB